IGRTALEQILNQEQAKVQQEILRLREKQREAREKVAEVEKRLRKGDKLSADDLNNLLQAEQAQQQGREGVGSPKEGLRKEVNRILETLRQNRMEKSGTRDVMDNVARELERIAGSELEQIEPRLTNARKQAELLEEKPREERRKRLEGQARETEKQAREAEQAANKQEEAAAAKEKQADAKNAGDPDKARLGNEAKQQRQQAAENRKKAAELRQQAERERRDAADAPDQNQPRQQLA